MKKQLIKKIIIEALNGNQMDAVKAAGRNGMQLKEMVNILVDNYLTDVVENGNENAVNEAKNTIQEIKNKVNEIENQLNF